jgi:arginyl-tRNA synthetase
VAGPGFLNINFSDDVLWRQVADRLSDPRLGIAAPEAGTVSIVDYSHPNIAKEMHVGHLRSTIIGDALARLLAFLGGSVIRQNHLGDWGTQFGMLIQYHVENGPAGDLYRRARKQFESDPEFADRARRRVVDLQSGGAESTALWRQLVAESKLRFAAVYDRLGVLLTDADVAGESSYNLLLAGVAADLEALGVARWSDGALCVFTAPSDPPLIVRKGDGGFGYAATDLAAIRYRVATLHAVPLAPDPRLRRGPTLTASCTWSTPGKRCISGRCSRPPGGLVGCRRRSTCGTCRSAPCSARTASRSKPGPAKRSSWSTCSTRRLNGRGSSPVHTPKRSESVR